MLNKTTLFAVVLIGLFAFTECRSFWMGEHESFGAAMRAGANANAGMATETELVQHANKKGLIGEERKCIVSRTTYCDGLTIKEAKMKWGNPNHRTNGGQATVLGWNLPQRTISVGFVNGESQSITEMGSVYH